MIRTDSPALDAGILQRNIAALSSQQPQFCELIESVELPDEVVFAEGRDGSSTFRLPAADGTRYWLGHSSMPTVSSPAVLAEFVFGGGNVLLPTIGHGGEAKHLLMQMAAHQAVFAWDSGPLIPALALRLHDFSGDISRGRLVLAIGPKPEEALLRSFENHRTHLPPTKILCAPHLKPSDIHELQTQAESAAAKQNARLMQLTAQITRTWVQSKSSADRAGRTRCAGASDRKLMILSMMVDPEVTRVANALGQSATQAGMECVTYTVDRPQHAHLLAAAQQLQAHHPTDVILLNQAKGEWGDLLNHVRYCTSWWVSPSALRAESVNNLLKHDTLWVVNRQLAEQIQSSGDGTPQVRILGPAADSTMFCPTELHANDYDEYGSDIAIIMNAVDFSPEAIGLKWESHKTLLDEIIHLIRDDPRRLTLAAADHLIEKASRRTKVKLDSAEVRGNLARFISAGIAPTLTVLKLIEMLPLEKVRVKLWGANWETHGETAPVQHAAPPSPAQRNKVYNAVKIVVHVRHDEWHEQHLLDALAAGGCVLNQVGPDSRTHQGQVWEELREAVPSFSTVSQAVRMIQDLLADERMRRARMPRAHQTVKAKHLMASRLKTLLGDE